MIENIIQGKKRALLVQPDFPTPIKSRNHKNHLPIGLLKISAFLKSRNIEVELSFVKNNTTNESIEPDIIFVTSLFTYWSKYVKDVVFYLKEKYPSVPIVVGGIYASLMPIHCKDYTQCDYVIQGPIKEAEELCPDYSLIETDYQIIHTSRGCPRKCKYCGANDIEPEWNCKYSIKNEIFKKKIIFYDNNLLANDYIDFLLDELIELKKERKINYVESQSGVDGRILLKKPYLAFKMKKAGFQNVKIAWDGPYKGWKRIERQIIILEEAGFTRSKISLFMIYNAHLPYEEMERKRVKCAEWGVQIVCCRYIPLNQTFDNYNPYKTNQTNDDYYISEEFGWTDLKNKKFKKNIRYTNISVRYRLGFFSKSLKKDKRNYKLSKEEARKTLDDFWDPLEFHEFNEDEAKPFLRWVGNKQQILPEIEKLAKKKDKYVEPFLGGGSVFFSLSQKNKYSCIWLNDINDKLITTYQIIKERPHDLIEEIEKIKIKYDEKDFEEQKEIYLKEREEFNETNDSLKIASKLIFLNRTCYGGLYRTNAKGEFNTSFLKRGSKLDVDYDNILKVSKAIQNVNFSSKDYKDCLKHIDKDTFVFLDPPYQNSFDKYYKESYTKDDLEELASFCNEIDKKGASFILCQSNSYDVEEDFKHFNIKRVSVKRPIKKHEVVEEYIIYN